jgi:hypothetical protein
VEISSGEAIARGTGFARAAATIFFVIAIAASVLVVAGSHGKSFYPKQWDPRIAPIARKVAQLRGLEFTHYVPVHFLPPAEFEKEVAGGAAENRDELEREASIVRALGLVAGNVDLAKSVKQAASSGALAYYRPDREEIVVRGSTFDVSHQVTVAHELTHVLQDQHFDIERLQKTAGESKTGSSDALSALIEGDAVRIEDKYKAGLTAAQKRAYADQQRTEGERVKQESAGVPALIEFLFSAPYVFGPVTMKILDENGGNRAVDDALRGPIPASSLFIEPGEVAPAEEVPVPTVPSKATGDPETFGAFELALMLGMQIDPDRALHTADGVSGGEAVTYKSAGTTCYRVDLAARRRSARNQLHLALADWAKTMPHATVHSIGQAEEFTACDPGKHARGPEKARFQTLAQRLGERFELALTFVQQGHLGIALSRCIAREFLADGRSVALLEAVGNGTPTDQQRQELRQLAVVSRTACEADADAGMP